MIPKVVAEECSVHSALYTNDDECVGTATMSNYGFITTVAIHPSLRGFGCGKLIMANLIVEAHKRGLDRVGLDVYGWNVYAQKFYANLGFTENQYGHHGSLTMDLTEAVIARMNTIIQYFTPQVEALDVPIDNERKLFDGMSYYSNRQLPMYLSYEA